jgi:hypothetical protein
MLMDSFLFLVLLYDKMHCCYAVSGIASERSKTDFSGALKKSEVMVINMRKISATSRLKYI